MCSYGDAPAAVVQEEEATGDTLCTQEKTLTFPWVWGLHILYPLPSQLCQELSVLTVFFHSVSPQNSFSESPVTAVL